MTSLGNQTAHIDLYMVLFVNLRRETDAGDGGHAEVTEQIGNAEFRRLYDTGNELLELLLQQVQRRGGLTALLL